MEKHSEEKNSSSLWINFTQDPTTTIGAGFKEHLPFQTDFGIQSKLPCTFPPAHHFHWFLGLPYVDGGPFLNKSLERHVCIW